MIQGLRTAPLDVQPGTASLQDVVARAQAGSMLALPAGEIACDLRPLHETSGKRRRFATYELLVANNTPVALATSAYAVRTSTTSNHLTGNAFVVPAYSAIAVAFDITLPRQGQPVRVFAEFEASGARMTIESEPPRRRTRRLGTTAAFVCLGIIVALLGAMALAANRPSVVALAAPEHVSVGSSFPVAYAVRGAERIAYSVEMASGTEVARGSLNEASGAFSVALPKSAISRGYEIRVSAHGRFGNVDRAVHVSALPASQPTEAQRPRAPAKTLPNEAQLASVEGLHLGQKVVYGGEPIDVNYRTSATAGMVRLLDQLGTVRAEALLDRAGHSILVAPFVAVAQDFRVVVVGLHGSARAEAAVSVRILSPKHEPAASAAAAGSGTSGTSGGGSAEPISVDPSVAAGEPIVVRILAHASGLHLSLIDSDGGELQNLNVPAGNSNVVFPLASLPAGRQLSIVATFAQGFGEETVVRRVVIRAR